MHSFRCDPALVAQQRRMKLALPACCRWRLMKKALLALLTFASVGAQIVGADLPPSLKPLAEQFDTARQQMTDSGEVHSAPARARYLAALAAAEKAAAAAVKTTDVAAIANEVESVKSGSLPPAAPRDLPRALAAPRNAYVSTAAAVARTLAPRQQELATKYLQTLAVQETAALKAQDTVLTEAISAEKQRVTALFEPAATTMKFRNILTNGNFSQGADGAWPPGWRKEVGDLQASDATLVSERGNKFLRFRRLQAMRRANLIPEKDIEVPPKVKNLEFSVRLRVKALLPGKEYDTHPGVRLAVYDARGEELREEWLDAKADTNWRRFSGQMEMPPAAKKLHVVIGPHAAAGIIDIDDVVVEFR